MYISAISSVQWCNQITVVLRCNGAIPSTVSLCTVLYVYICDFFGAMVQSNHCGSSVQWCNSKHCVPVHGTVCIYLRFLRCNGAIKSLWFFGAMVQFQALCPCARYCMYISAISSVQWCNQITVVLRCN